MGGGGGKKGPKHAQMFNMDESGMPLDAKSPKVFAPKGRSVSAIGSEDKTQITLVACISAAGYCLPSMVVWNRKIISPELTIGEVPMAFQRMAGWTWSCSTSGFAIIFCGMLLRPVLYFCSWMATHHTIVRIEFDWRQGSK